MHATLEEFLDRQRSGLASTYLTRLKVGPRLVDAAAVPHLYSGRVRPRHVLVVLLAGCGGSKAAAPAKPGSLRKGMTLAEVEAALGRPDRTTERSEGLLKVLTATYSRDDQRITAEFVEGVLIKYSISSR